MSSTRLTDLARTILQQTSKIEDYFNTNNLPAPSFDEHSPAELPLSADLHSARQQSIDAAIELQDLLMGPTMQLRPVLNGTSLQAIYKYDIPSHVPLDGEISFEELAPKAGLKQSDLQRILRFAMIHHRVFQEKRPGIVSHSAASRFLVEDVGAMAGLGFMFDECYQSFAHTVEVLEAHRDPGPDESGWSVAHRQATSMWAHHTAHPELGERAGLAMAAFTKGFNHDTTALMSRYDWNTASAKRSLLVDLGGADGNIAIKLAREYDGLTCIVQDIPEVIVKAAHKVPEDLADRVEVVAHDFFEPQPTSADIYLFRQIFHNWGDAYCVKILQALIPALKAGAKILVNDAILPAPGVLKPMQERAVRSMDMIMMSLFNSREREESDWKALIAQADSRFVDVKVRRPERSHLGLIEATWSG